MIPYDIFKHGIGSRIFNKNTNRYGIISDIKETSNEYIEPFVLYDTEIKATKEDAYALMFIDAYEAK